MKNTVLLLLHNCILLYLIRYCATLYIVQNDGPLQFVFRILTQNMGLLYYHIQWYIVHVRVFETICIWYVTCCIASYIRNFCQTPVHIFPYGEVCVCIYLLLAHPFPPLVQMKNTYFFFLYVHYPFCSNALVYFHINSPNVVFHTQCMYSLSQYISTQ